MLQWQVIARYRTSGWHACRAAFFRLTFGAPQLVAETVAALGGPGPLEVVAAAGPQAAEGMINVLYADPSNPEYQALVERYRQRIGQAPNEYIVPRKSVCPGSSARIGRTAANRISARAGVVNFGCRRRKTSGIWR